jgi:hypothetical protein
MVIGRKRASPSISERSAPLVAISLARSWGFACIFHADLSLVLVSTRRCGVDGWDCDLMSFMGEAR